MSKYVVYYSSRKEMYRDMASRWYRWSNETNLTDDQRTGVALFFRSIGRRFGLLGEFHEIGVI